jgi:Zn-dependent M28 family amino/carboxypeptidase
MIDGIVILTDVFFLFPLKSSQETRFPAFPTDAQLLEGSRDAIRQSGREVDEAILWHERGDGYAALSQIFRHGVPDAIIIWGEQGPGLQHYFDRHPKLKRPAIITKENYADELTDSFPKYILPANSPQISQWVQEAVQDIDVQQ